MNFTSGTEVGSIWCLLEKQTEKMSSKLCINKENTRSMEQEEKQQWHGGQVKAPEVQESKILLGLEFSVA